MSDRDSMLGFELGDENDLTARVARLERLFELRDILPRVKSEEALDFRAIDGAGNLRMIMSAINLLEEFGISAYLAGFDENGKPTLWLDADFGSLYLKDDVLRLLLQWHDLGQNTISGDNVYAVAYDPLNNVVYVGGDFTEIGGLTGVNGIAKYDIDADEWSALGTGLGAGGSAAALAVDSAGNLYIGGTFTNVGDANGDNIVKWNGSAFSSLSTGIPTSVKALAIDSSDNVYVGGGFMNVGDANGNRIVKWNGSAWVSLSTGIGNGTVFSLAVDSSDNLYIGGSFTDIGDANGDRIIKWNGTAFSSLSTGIGNGAVNAMAFDSAGNLYVGGQFTNLTDANGDYISKWNGSAFSSLATGLNGNVSAIAVDSADNVYVGGDFTNAGGDADADRIALWNGTAFESLQLGLDNTVLALALSNIDSLFVGGRFRTGGTQLLGLFASYSRVSLKKILTYILDKLSDPTVNAITFIEQADPATPSNGYAKISVFTNGLPYFKGDDGTKRSLTGEPTSAFISAHEIICNKNLADTSASTIPYGFYRGPSAANAADGDTYDVQFVIAAGTYTLAMHGVKATTAGKVDGYIDGSATPTWTGDDWYAAATSENEFTHSVTFTTGGRHTLRMKINGKNAASADYRLLLSYLTLVPSSYAAEIVVA